MNLSLRHRRQIGKYKIKKRLANSGFAYVFEAYDEIEGIPVALKVPHQQHLSKETLELFRYEARLAARLDHPNILKIKNAAVIDRHFIIASALGQDTLAKRMQKRMSLKLVLDLFQQLLAALEHAHRNKIIHCDVKPENLLMFPGNLLRLADFGISKVARRTIQGSGSGTVGYMAPEQAMGKPCYGSDVFSAGLILYQMLTGYLPEWPFEWPAKGHARLKEKVHPEMIALLRRCLEINPQKRYKDAPQLLAAFLKAKSKTIHRGAAKKRKISASVPKDWRGIRYKDFKKLYGRELEAKHQCHKCEGPVSEFMTFCPWCEAKVNHKHIETVFPEICNRCHRGVKKDWRFCPWCYGGVIHESVDRDYADKRYDGSKCRSTRCNRKVLMPFMKYCPWCRTKTTKKMVYL